MRLASLVFACLSVAGQTPKDSSVTKAPGEKVTFQIFANSQPARAPVALKWEMVFPVQLMDMEGDAEMGSAGMDSGKSLKCTPQKEYSYGCILSGGKNPIANGEIAIFHFRIRTRAETVTTALRIERAVAIMADATEEPLNNTESVVIIR